MERRNNFGELPDDLPEPVDDGAADHLPGTTLPSIELASTGERTIDLSSLKGRVVLYCYPMTGRPDQNVIPEGWDAIPGARGCTPQSCAFRDHHQELQSLGARVFGLSTQTTEYQREAKERLHLPFELLSDARFSLAETLGLPAFRVDNRRYLKRTTLIINDGCIETVFYPVFPPDRNADEVIIWLGQHPPEKE